MKNLIRYSLIIAMLGVVATLCGFSPQRLEFTKTLPVEAEYPDFDQRVSADYKKVEAEIDPAIEKFRKDAESDYRDAYQLGSADGRKAEADLDMEVRKARKDLKLEFPEDYRDVAIEDKKVDAEIDPEYLKLREDTVQDLEDAGNWIKNDDAKLDRYLKQEAADIKHDVLHEENKIGYWLDGRSISSIKAQAIIAHNNLLVTTKYPSASQCAECHPGQYRQWSVSSHAYAQLSPVYNSMQARLNKLMSGTNGDFCVRCHNQVGMSIKEPIFTANANRLPVTREGISCIVCHRIKEAYGRVSARFSLETGPITDPMYGPRGDKVLKEVLHDFQVTTDNAKGTMNWQEEGKQVIHSGAVKVKTFDTPQLCSSCHDVLGQNGFRLEEAYSQFRNAPAAQQGITCQDCHMGKVLGEVSGYDEGPIAYIGGIPTPSGKRSNHMFAGPDYSVVEPGIFPQNAEAVSIATFQEWLQFNTGALWGTDAFENKAQDRQDFPAAWQDSRHRRRARGFIDDQLRLLEEYRAQCARTLRHGYQFGDFNVLKNDSDGIDFNVDIVNATNGHGVPTGFDAERLVFVETTVVDHSGHVVFKSGDRDPNGDVRDLHSSYVGKGLLPEDDQLVTFQSKFLLNSLRGGEREQILPVGVSLSPLPFFRPNVASSLLNAGPATPRKQAYIIPPNGKRTAKYRIDKDALTGNGPYTVRLRFICQMVPVNLLNDISAEGFDYGLTPHELADRVVEGGYVLWDRTIQIPTEGTTVSLKPTHDEVLGPVAISPGLPWLNYNPPPMDQVLQAEKEANIDALKAEKEGSSLDHDVMHDVQKVEDYWDEKGGVK